MYVELHGAVPLFLYVLPIPVEGGRFKLLQSEEQAVAHATKVGFAYVRLVRQSPS